MKWRIIAVMIALRGTCAEISQKQYVTFDIIIDLTLSFMLPFVILITIRSFYSFFILVLIFESHIMVIIVIQVGLCFRGLILIAFLIHHFFL